MTGKFGGIKFGGMLHIAVHNKFDSYTTSTIAQCGRSVSVREGTFVVTTVQGT